MKKSSQHTHTESHKHPKATSELLSELPLEDKLWILWQRYSRHLVLVIAVIVLGLLGYQGISWYKTSQVEKLQNEYRDARAEGRELNFAEVNIKDPLAGTIFVSRADQFVEEGKYDEALANYQQALKSLKDTPVGDRIQLGVAMITFIKGDKDTGKDLLKKLVNNQQYLGAIRGEAAYQLVLINLQEKDYITAKDFITVISRIPNAGIWAQKATILQASTPELISKE